MLIASRSGTSIILKTTLAVDYTLERKVGTGAWTPWTGIDWSAGVPAIITTPNFTDYDLVSGVYQYRTFTTEYDYSNCIVIGSDPNGWTFENYVVPESQFGEILTSDDMRLTYLWGVDLTAGDGTTWTDAQSRTMIKWAVYQLEKKLNIDIYPREYYSDDLVNENIEESKLVIKDFPYPSRRRKRYLITARHRPIREVTRLDWYSPTDQRILDLTKWMRVDKRNGSIWFFPKQGKLDVYSYGWPWTIIMNSTDYPDAFHINMKTGYKSAEFLPEDLRDIVGKIAALKMLNAIGDGLLAGFSSSSISLDGLSESFSSTQSATSSYFGARIKVYQDDIKEYIAENKNKYGNFRIGSI